MTLWIGLRCTSAVICLWNHLARKILAWFLRNPNQSARIREKFVSFEYASCNKYNAKICTAFTRSRSGNIKSWMVVFEAIGNGKFSAPCTLELWLFSSQSSVLSSVLLVKLFFLELIYFHDILHQYKMYTYIILLLWHLSHPRFVYFAKNC